MKVWVAAWLIDWSDYELSFSIVGVAATEEAAERLLADEMVSVFGGTIPPREDFPEAVTWLGAISHTCIAPDDDDHVLAEAASIDFLIEEQAVTA